MLASVGVIADVTPATGALYAKFAKVFKPSKLSTKGISNGLEQVIKEGVDATKTVDGLGTDLDTAFGKIAKGIGECGAECSDRVEAATKVYADELHLDSKTTLGKVNTDFQDSRYDALNSSSLDRIADIEASVYCVARKLAGAVAITPILDRARTVPKNLCPKTTVKDSLLRVTQVTAVLDPAYINGGTNPTETARDWVKVNGAGSDDAGHILAYVLGGAGGVKSENIVPVLSSLNQGDISRFEKTIAQSVRTPGNTVTLTVNLEYLNPAYPKRPSKLEYVVEVNNGTSITTTTTTFTQ